MVGEKKDAAPASITEYDHRDQNAWMYSFGAAMIPFTAFCYGHSKGVTVRVVERMVKSPFGVYGLLALPFVTLGMEKCIYDTVQSWQGINPNVRPKDRGGFPSGGAGTCLKSILYFFICVPFKAKIINNESYFSNDMF